MSRYYRSFLEESGSVYTSRTTAFATATGITDTTILNALSTFDAGLISNGLDTKMKAIYPMVGGTATTHKYNFIDPRDLDVAFRLTFNGGWVHSSTGAKPNGTNAYANTFFNPSNSLSSILSAHLSIYSRTQIRGGLDASCNDGYEMTIGADFNSSGIYGLSGIGNQYAVNLNPNTSIGFFLANRQSSTNLKIIQGNITLASQTTTSSARKPNVNISLGAQGQLYQQTFYTAREQAFTSIGNGLTDGEATILYNLVQSMQTSLNRNV